MDTQLQKKYKILLIGDDCLDIYQYGTVDRISPEAPVPIFKSSYEEQKAGMARNVFNNLEALGCDTTFLCGKESIKTRLIDIRSKQHIVRIDNDVASNPIVFDPSSIIGFDAIVISDYDKGTVSTALIERLRKEFTGPIFVDTKKTDLVRFEGCIIKINLKEFNKLTSRPKDTALIVTHGENGVIFGDQIFLAQRVEVADVTGAGDTFLAALAYQYLHTTNMKQSIEFAIKASAVSVQRLGVYAPTLEEII